MRKSQAMPIDLVVKLIIAILIFGIGFFLFGQFFSTSEDKVDDLSSQLRQNIESIECEGLDWLCISSMDIKSNEEKSSSVFIVNKDKSKAEFRIKIDLDDNMIKKSCGEVLVNYYDGEIKIEPSKSTSIPVNIKPIRITQKPCSFISKISLLQNDIEKQVIPLIININ